MEMKKMKSKKNIVPGISVAVVIIIIFAMSMMSTAPQEKTPNMELEERFQEIIQVESSQTERKQYLPKSVQDYIFSDAESKHKFPEDFYMKRAMVHYGYVGFDPDAMGPEYWEQPEWFPMFEEKVIPNIITYTGSEREPGWCLGIWQKYRIVKARIEETATNDSAKLTFWSWVRVAPPNPNYHGVKIKPVYPNYAKIAEFIEDLPENQKQWEGFSVEQSTDLAKQYIDVGVSPEENILLYPNYPKWYANSTMLVRTDITIKPGIPKGWYIVGYDAGYPDEEFDEAMRMRHGFGYISPYLEIHCQPKEFRVFIQIM
jgi:hypothetical protein